MTGELVTETFDYDGGRPVTAYVPPAPPEAVVFAGDGQRRVLETGVPADGGLGVQQDAVTASPDEMTKILGAHW
jgi:hypothetical protein